MRLILGTLLVIICSFLTVVNVKSNYVPESQIIKIKAYSNITTENRTEIECLAQNIFFEAKGESDKGKLAVALVTLNRSRSELYPTNLCQVVREKRLQTCQFSWWCNAKLRSKATQYSYNTIERLMYEEIRKIALYTYMHYDEIKDVTHGAMYYHANYVNPKWKFASKTVQIGNHIFYRLETM
jgi:spore germination cell wall hydrolase CwlJ-like protein